MIDVSTFTLPNGLRVAHNYDPGTAMAALGVLYDTGARDESEDLTGMAHLFEHLMFGGSVNVPVYDAVLERAGGTNNAATSNDFTFFYDIVPAQNIETPFYLESDRMLSLAFSDKVLEVQRNVVIEEFKQVSLNQPYGRTMHLLRPMLYPGHPYSWPVIGKDPSHIEAVTQDDVRRWHAGFYSPGNAILVVAGNVTLERVRSLAEKWFGGIPARPRRRRNLPEVPWPVQRQMVTVTEQVPQTAIMMGYRMDPYGLPGYFAADAITDILAAGKSARMQQRLVLGTDLFTVAEASITGNEHSGMVLVNAMLRRDDDAGIDLAIDMLEEQLKQLAEEGNVTDYELSRAKNRYESVFTFENMGLVDRVRNIAGAVYHGEDINEAIPRYRALTTADIATTARRLFIDHAPAIVVTRPAK